MANDLELYGKWVDRGAAVLNVRHPDFGAVGDGVTDDLAAFHAAIEAAGPATWGAPPAAVSGAVVFAPPGAYRLGGDLRIDRPIIFAGAGQGGDNPATRLYFDDGFGIVVDGPGTSSDGGRADWTTIRDMGLTSAGQTVAGVHGIHAKVRVLIDNVLVDSFSGDGILIDGTLRVSDSQTANCWSVARSRLWGNGGNGLHITGEDGNCGNAWAVDCTSNEGYGIYDESSLGNTYLGCHFDNNHLGWMRVRNASARSSVWGGYVESNISFPTRHTGYFRSSVAIGNVQGGAVILPDPDDGASVPPAVFSRQIEGAHFYQGSDGQEVYPFPFADELLGFKGKSASNYLILRRVTSGEAAGCYELVPKADTTKVVARWPDTGAASDIQGKLWAPGGILIGDGTARRALRQATSMPAVAGKFGERAFNSDYGWSGAGANQWVWWWANTDDGTTWEAVGKAAAQVDSTAATVADLKADLNALLAKLRAAGLMAA